MKTAYFRFYAELNDFFPPGQSGTWQHHQFKGIQSVKDRIESMGVPHPEVSLILSNGEPVDFSYHVQAEDSISVYPAFRTFDLISDIRLRPLYEPPYQFVLDVHLGKLAHYMRILGFDTWYRNDYDDPELARISDEEDRILLTSDHGLLKRSRVTYGYFIREDDPREQLYSVLSRYDLFDKIGQRGRCTECNTLLEAVEKEKIIDKLEPKTKKYYQEFYLCQQCNKIYWKGSHYQNMLAGIDGLKRN